MSLPTRHWYISIYSSIFLNLSKLMIRIYWCVCVTHQLPDFFKKVPYIFLQRNKKSLLKCATSIPRKYFNLPNYSISNPLVKHCLKVHLSFPSFLVMMTFYTYNRRVVTSPKSKCLINNIWFPWLCLHLTFFITMANLLNHALGDCFNPYKPFFGLYIFSMARSLPNPRGTSTYISSSKSPRRNVFFMSKYCRSQL